MHPNFVINQVKREKNQFATEFQLLKLETQQNIEL